jgi:hypothetical protein
MGLAGIGCTLGCDAGFGVAATQILSKTHYKSPASCANRSCLNRGIELSTICRQFKMKVPSNRLYEIECADAEGMPRIIQSIPPPRAEPFKRWLALANPLRARRAYIAQIFGD